MERDSGGTGSGVHTEEEGGWRRGLVRGDCGSVNIESSS